MAKGIQFFEQEHIPDSKPTVYLAVGSADEALSAQEKIERKGGMRLTAAMRQSICDKVFEFKFKKSGDKLDATEEKLAHRAMISLFGEDVLTMLAKLGPPYAIAAHNCHGEALTGDELKDWRGNQVAFRVGAEGYQHSLRVKDPVPMGVNMNYRAHKRFVIKAGALADAIKQWVDDVQAWQKEKREMELKLNAVLNSVTTFNSLQKTWPDGERFWKHLPIDFPFRNQVPAVKVDDLNNAIGL